jgi:cytochrome c553
MSAGVPSTRTLAAAALLVLSVLAAPLRAQDMSGGNEIARRALHVCASCHGENGLSKNAEFPHLAAQPALYTVRQLRDFRAGKRTEIQSSAFMWGISALLDDATIQALADYYAEQAPAAGHRPKASREVLRAGQDLFENGLPGKGVRPCADCHSDKGEGEQGFPRLAGQHADYVERQLKLFSTRLRPHGVLMKAEVAMVSPLQMKAVAAYVQSMTAPSAAASAAAPIKP